MRSLIFLIFLFGSLYGEVYDCFLFNGEYEILKIRLHELDPYVDHFVLVEWDRGHRLNNKKPFYFELAKEDYAEFLPKIIHIKLTESFPDREAWGRENWHRNQIMRALTDCHADDIILISDVDEIPPGKAIPLVKQQLRFVKEFGFWMMLYQWYLNRWTGFIWSGTVATTFKHLTATTPQDLRNRFRSIENLSRWHMGWHFTSMGGYDRCARKYYDVVEGYDAFMDYEQWRSLVDACRLVEIDHTYPQWVQNNLDYLIENGLIDLP